MEQPNLQRRRKQVSQCGMKTGRGSRKVTVPGRQGRRRTFQVKEQSVQSHLAVKASDGRQLAGSLAPSVVGENDGQEAGNKDQSQTEKDLHTCPEAIWILSSKPKPLWF